MSLRKVVLTTGLALGIGAGLAACSDDDPGPTVPGPDPDDGVRFARDVQPIFDNSCAVACHNPDGVTTPNGDLSLVAGDSHAQLVGVDSPNYDGWVRVVAGDPDGSLLYQKLLDTTVETGNRMPLNGQLEAGQIETIRVWIAEGAKND